MLEPVMVKEINLHTNRDEYPCVFGEDGVSQHLLLGFCLQVREAIHSKWDAFSKTEDILQNTCVHTMFLENNKTVSPLQKINSGKVIGKIICA